MPELDTLEPVSLETGIYFSATAKNAVKVMAYAPGKGCGILLLKPFLLLLKEVMYQANGICPGTFLLKLDLCCPEPCLRLPEKTDRIACAVLF